MSAGPAPLHTAEKASGVRFSVVSVALGVVIVIASVALLVFLLRGKSTIVVPTHAIPRFAQIESTDLTTKRVWSQNLDGGTASEAGKIVGGIARQALPAGNAIAAETVTAPVKGTIGAVRLEVVPGQSKDLDLSPGERVRLWLSPTRRGGEVAGVCALILEVPKAGAGESQAYVVAVNRKAAKVLQTDVGQARLMVAAID